MSFSLFVINPGSLLRHAKGAKHYVKLVVQYISKYVPIKLQRIRLGINGTLLANMAAIYNLSIVVDT